MLLDDRPFYDMLACTAAVLALAWLVVGLSRLVARRRPGLALGRPLAVAALARLAAAGLLAAVPSLRSLRGPDDAGFLHAARQLASDPSSLGPMPRALVGNLQVAYMSVVQYILDPFSDYPLRVAHIALAVAAIAVVAVAVSDIAGVRAGVLSAWLLALEPTNIFFSGVLHKESPMLLGEALVILGAVRMYQRRDIPAVVIMGIGLAVAGLTRPYAGAALAVACAVVCLHAALRRLGPRRRRSPQYVVGVAVALLVAVAAAPAPAAVLHAVQVSQNANATDASNLALPAVDFSSSSGVARNLGSRVSELILRPLPWQATNMSQRFGILGTTAAWALILAMIVLLATRLRTALAELPPLFYVLVLLTIVYALSTGNAGTGFRYRAHLLVVLAAIVAALTQLPVRPLRKARANDA
jgi:hypothetical protein